MCEERVLGKERLMKRMLHFDDLEVGHRWESPPRVIGEEDVFGFAHLTGDHTPLHTDYDYASETPFGQPIAHGLLGLSVLAGLSSDCPSVDTAAFLSVQDWKFLQPIYFDDTVRVVTEVVELEPRGRRRGRVLWKRQLVNQHDAVVQEGILETLVMVSPASRTPREKLAELQTAVS